MNKEREDWTEERLEERVREELKEVDVEEMYRDILNEPGPCIVAGCTFYAADVLESMDPTAYRCGMNDFEDSLRDEYEEIDGRYYDKKDVEKIREDLEDEYDEQEAEEAEHNADQAEDR